MEQGEPLDRSMAGAWRMGEQSIWRVHQGSILWPAQEDSTGKK